MTDTMDYTDFENEAEREERESVEAGNPLLADSDYEYGYSMAEREEVEVDAYLAEARYRERQYSDLYDALYGNPWDAPWPGSAYDY